MALPMEIIDFADTVLLETIYAFAILTTSNPRFNPRFARGKTSSTATDSRSLVLGFLCLIYAAVMRGRGEGFNSSLFTKLPGEEDMTRFIKVERGW